MRDKTNNPQISYKHMPTGKIIMLAKAVYARLNAPTYQSLLDEMCDRIHLYQSTAEDLALALKVKRKELSDTKNTLKEAYAAHKHSMDYASEEVASACDDLDKTRLALSEKERFLQQMIYERDEHLAEIAHLRTERDEVLTESSRLRNTIQKIRYMAYA